MPKSDGRTKSTRGEKPGRRDTAADVQYALAWLEKRGTKSNREGMARYGIVAKKVFGVSMTTMKSLAKELGRDHALSQSLFKTGMVRRAHACVARRRARSRDAGADGALGEGVRQLGGVRHGDLLPLGPQSRTPGRRSASGRTGRRNS
jgi:hypothetical protein